MLVVFVFFATLEAALAGYAGSSSNSVGDGTGFGYGGSFSGSGSSGGNIPNPVIPPFDIGSFNTFLDSLQKYHQHFINNLQEQIQQGAQQQQFTQSRFGGDQNNDLPSGGGSGSYGGGFGGSYSGTGGGALAAASIGPQGGFQSASVYPANPNNPNIFNRFGGASQGGGGGNGGGGGSYGVYTSSVSSSSNLNGKPQNYHQASTTVNDNGKVTTYTVKNP